MRQLIACGVLVCAVTLPASADRGRRVTFVDLAPHTNQKLTEGLGDDSNTLAALPTGEQTFGGVRFKIGTGLIQVSGKESQDKPEKVEGIKVGTTCSKLYILHACHFGGKDGAIVGYYTVTYDDNSQETIPIVYGKDILDWWYNADSKEPSRGKVGWQGDNDNAKGMGARIRLYVTAWKNPEPARKVVGIDFGSTNAEEAAPFCVAITAEE
jgi:hypothetical protein